MKRYKLDIKVEHRPEIALTAEPRIDYRMVEDPNGEWVRYEDVDALISKAYKEGYFTGHNTASLAEPWQIKVVGSECNCADVSSGMIEGGLAPEFPTHPSWVCPQHGYKRL